MKVGWQWWSWWQYIRGSHTVNHIKYAHWFAMLRDHSEQGLSQWETTLYCNVIFHWLRPYSEWSLMLCFGICINIIINLCRLVWLAYWAYLSRLLHTRACEVTMKDMRKITQCEQQSTNIVHMVMIKMYCSWLVHVRRLYLAWQNNTGELDEDIPC